MVLSLSSSCFGLARLQFPAAESATRSPAIDAPDESRKHKRSGFP